MSVTNTRAARSGGRTAARATRARRAPEYPTQGSTALRAERAGAPQEAAPRLKVAPPLPVAGPRAPFVALILVVVVGGVLGILMLNTKVNENAFRLHDLQQRQTELDQQQQRLEQQLADYESPGNLAANARKLGLVPAGAPAFIRLPDGRITGVPQPAGGEPSLTSTDAGR
jgi:hypothetical protein